MSFAVTERNAEGKNTRRVSHPRKETKISVQDRVREAGTARTIYFTSAIVSLFSLIPRSTAEVSEDSPKIYAR